MISYVFEIAIQKENSTKTLTFKTNKHLNKAITELKENINKKYLNRISTDKNIIGIELRCIGKELSHPNFYVNTNGEIRFSTNFTIICYGTFRQKMGEKQKMFHGLKLRKKLTNI